MNFLGKVFFLLACTFGFVCTLGGLLTNRSLLLDEDASPSFKACAACTIISLLIFIGLAIFTLGTLRFELTDKITGIAGAITGSLACVFAMAGYCSFSKFAVDAGWQVPTTPEWLFGAMTTGCGLLLVSLILIFQ